VLLASRRELELVAVTTVSGDVGLRARIAARLLGLAGRGDVEVCAGERAPLLRATDRFGWFGHEGEGLAAGPDAPLSDEPAPARIARAARERPGLELLAVGPLTNLARALALDPELPSRAGGLTVMGGHLRRAAIGARVFEPGIDYNLCSDPEAAVAVLGAGFRTTLVPADVTLQTWMGPRHVERLAAAAGPVAPALAALVPIWTRVQRRLFAAWEAEEPRGFAAFLHDPLTALALVDAAPLRFEEIAVAPTIRGGVFRTIEVAPESPAGTRMRVATRVDAAAAAEAIVARLEAI
jgi:inosine-uridine nucleoside N-ribohydrolase